MSRQLLLCGDICKTAPRNVFFFRVTNEKKRRKIVKSFSSHSLLDVILGSPKKDMPRKLSEGHTRKQLIDPQLEKVGWYLRDHSKVKHGR